MDTGTYRVGVVRLRSAVLAVVALALLAGCQVPLGTVPASVHPSAGATVTVPDVTGRRLSDAKTVLGEAGFTKINANDATDRDRTVIDPMNWVVVSETPRAGTTVVAGTAITLAVRRPSDRPAQATTIGRIPGVVCLNLQDAQDALRKSGFLNLRSTDGSGKARFIILDRDWLVTAQSAKPGSKPSLLTRIVLTAVKYGEPTGSSGCAS
jgi:beta-lactam-binding protein with PASTA domain